MEDENRFWLRICGMVTLILLGMIGSCTHASHDRRDKWEKAVANGADPMVAACAVFSQGSTTEEITCLLMAQNRK